VALTIGIPKEVHEGERRVAATPETSEKLQKLGFGVVLESGAGERASFSDDLYREAGVRIIDDTGTLWKTADIILKVRAPEVHPQLGLHEAELLDDGKYLISFIWPAQNPDLMERLSERRVTVLAMDSIPRISRAQKLDALSSMANIAGYRAVVEAAGQFGRFLTGQITAAGKVPPAKVMVIGAGVAGLAAVGTANSMGAIVRAFDTRPEVKEQVESMGAEFLELDFKEDAGGGGGYAKVMSPEFIKAEMELFANQAMEVDIIITTALIPGRPAPELITEGMVESMRDGSVIVDLAAENGGNCTLTEPGKVVVRHGVTLIGYTDLPSRLPTQSSQLYGTNLLHMLSDLCKEKDGQITIDMDDEVIRGATVIKEGVVTWPPPAVNIQAAAKPEAAVPESVRKTEQTKSRSYAGTMLMLLGIAAMAGLGYVSPPEFLAHFTVFVLACFVGYQVVWNVTPALHTPLMSVTNAISGIIVLGALVQFSADSPTAVMLLSIVAVLVAAINISGGFLVTQRMLKMFQKYEEE
jgi:NAD(P) transhydrogenase subunit alpha